MLTRNIAIAYFLTLAKTSWFWLGIWILYYLRFTDYTGIGIIETMMIVTTTAAEIPTGAVADLFGKKKTLFIAFLLEALGGFMMAMAPNFNILATSVLVMCVGGALYSGTLEALLYDSMKQTGSENSYDKIISKINTIQLLTPAICGILGGFMYKVNPTLPFYSNAVFYIFGMVATLFLTEPSIDTNKFSFKNFVQQNIEGFRQLFKNNHSKSNIYLLLVVGFIIIITWEMLDSFMAVEFGYTASQLGILWSSIYLITALVSLLTPLIVRHFKRRASITLTGIITAITLVVSPLVGIVGGGLTLALRSSARGVFDNLASITINNIAESRFRATTLSTFNMIKNLPYVLSAYLIGAISDQISAKTTAMYLGVFLLVFVVSHLLFFRKYRHQPI